MRACCLIVLIGLAGCTNPITDRMDRFFDTLGQPPAPPPLPDDELRPGYAPAYPPIDLRPDQERDNEREE